MKISLQVEVIHNTDHIDCLYVHIYVQYFILLRKLSPSIQLEIFLALFTTVI